MTQSNLQLEFITKFGAERRGAVKNDTLQDAIPLVHDIVAGAVKESLDLYIVCGEMNQRKDQLFKQITGKSLGELLTLGLRAGCNICLLVWSADPDVLESEELKTLRRQAEGALGRLDIRSSDSGDPRFGHFVVAVNFRTDRWIVRLEQPHKGLESNLNFPVTAAVFFDNDLARTYGDEAMYQFAFYFGESDLIPSKYYPTDMDPSRGTERTSIEGGAIGEPDRGTAHPSCNHERGGAGAEHECSHH